LAPSCAETEGARHLPEERQGVTTPSDRHAPPRGGFVTAWARVVLLALVIAAIMVATGAFGGGLRRVVNGAGYWLGLTAVGAGMGVLVARLVVPGRWFDQRPWLAGGLIAASICLPMTLTVALAHTLLDHRPFSLAFIVEQFPSTLATTAGLTFLALLIQPRKPAQTHGPEPGAPAPRFLERLPDKLRGSQLWAVEAEDHYLRLHTSLGQDLILMRLGDAIAELEGIEGARTHRSWWVARSAVIGVERADGRATLTLESGAAVPVSRAYAKALREAGWF